jgi:heme exporter protein D
MRVLFCISILALVALLWASIAIARHVRQARRRQDRELQQDATTESKGRP